jgi:antitoxin component of RelBE/YafQ-DinJ toxin-antitoxin module
LAIRVDDDTLQKADAVADELGLNRSATIRMLVHQKYREVASTDADDPES